MHEARRAEIQDRRLRVGVEFLGKGKRAPFPPTSWAPHRGVRGGASTSQRITLFSALWVASPDFIPDKHGLVYVLGDLAYRRKFTPKRCLDKTLFVISSDVQLKKILRLGVFVFVVECKSESLLAVIVMSFCGSQKYAAFKNGTFLLLP